MDGIADRSSIPPPLPPKTRKNINSSNVFANNQVITTQVTSPSAKATVYGGVADDDIHVTSPTELSQLETLSFSFPEVRSLSLLSGQSAIQTASPSPHSIINGDHHVVKIRINPGDDAITNTAQYPTNLQQYQSLCGKPPVLSSFNKTEPQSLNFHPSHYTSTPAEGCIRISVSSSDVEQNEDMVRRSTPSTTSPSSSSSSIPGNFIKTSPPERANPYFFYGSFPANASAISSGQSSPSDTLDSGTCSDLDGNTPPPLPKKKSVPVSTATVTVTVNGGGHRRTGSLTSSGAEVDSDDDGSNISCDSLNSSELNGIPPVVEDAIQDVKAVNNPGKVNPSEIREEIKGVDKTVKPPTPHTPPRSNANMLPAGQSLPQGLLQDIRDRSARLTIVPSPCSTLTRKTRTLADDQSSKLKQQTEIKHNMDTINANLNGSAFKYQDISPTFLLSTSSDEQSKRSIVEQKTYEERQKETAEKQQSSTSNIFSNCQIFDTDKFYKFHLNEHVTDTKDNVKGKDIENEETFAGYRDLLQGKESSSTIRSAKGTVRGVKNRVRAGIATFLQLHATKNYKKEEAGKIVVYTTTMGVVRETYQDCLLVKKIFRNLMVKYEERDVFMSRETQTEIRERMGCDAIVVPQVFIEGQHVGNAETIEKLNESGELRRILKPFKNPDACSTCKVCGGHHLLPCSVCNGSKKSVHRNDFTAEFVALKCMHCDEVGLVRCYAC